MITCYVKIERVLDVRIPTTRLICYRELGGNITTIVEYHTDEGCDHAIEKIIKDFDVVGLLLVILDRNLQPVDDNGGRSILDAIDYTARELERVNAMSPVMRLCWELDQMDKFDLHKALAIVSDMSGVNATELLEQFNNRCDEMRSS